MRNPLAIFFAAIGLAAACNYLLYSNAGHAPGISVVIFFALYAAIFIGIALYNRTALRLRNLWPLPFFLYFALMIVFRENEFLTTLNLLAVFSGMLFLPFYLAAGSLQTIGLLNGALIPLHIGRAALVSGATLHREMKTQRAEQAAQGGQRSWISRHWGAVARGILISLPFLIFFGALMVSADEIFADVLARVFSVEILDWIFSGIGLVFRLTIFGWLAAGVLVYALVLRPAAPARSPLEASVLEVTKVFQLAFVETITVLTLVNLLFVSFVVIQISYLFGGVEYLATAEDFTYSDYARSGFFELVITAVFCVAFVLAAQRLSQRTGDTQQRWFGALTALLLALVLVLLVSAYNRMALYESTFGYTELRLQVYVFIAWLAILLAYLIGVILSDKSQFAVVGMVGAALGFLVTLNAINPDAFIVKRNVERHLTMTQSPTAEAQTDSSQATATEARARPANPGERSRTRRDSRVSHDPMLDISYLNSLSNDAVPELLAAHERLKSAPVAAAQIQRGLDRRRTELQEQEQNYNMSEGSRPGWQSWHYGRKRSATLLGVQQTQKVTSPDAISSPPTDGRR
ncbi:MAG: DUF4173 domain-containing protein [bacterium]|nr:DUF4173 domain-containing protein [bacterium]